MPDQIHWHEGLFLQPHHLQRLQRDLGQKVIQERRLLCAYPYGVIEAQLSADELANMRLRFISLRLVMPSGLEINFPENAEIPSIDIKPAFSSSGGGFTVYLGVPVWQERRANALELGPGADPRAKLIYRIEEAEYADENTGLNPKPLLVRRINARLVLENEDRNDLEVIPLLRIARAVGADIGAARLDNEFVPPCIFLTGSSVLGQMIRDLVNQIEASRKELVVQTTRGGFSLETMRGGQFEQVLRLRTLNRYSARLPALLATPSTTPFQWYLELREMLGELAALSPDKDNFDAAAYDHQNPFGNFNELCAKVRTFLKGAVAASFLKLDFKQEGDMYTAAFTDEHFTRPNEYYLGIKSKDDPRNVARLVEDPDRFKFMPKSLATRAIRGVELKEERFPPMQLPAQTGLSYFRLQRAEGSRVWQVLQAEKAAAVRWPGADTSDFQITLYMTIPD
jgi:type VI secretion system ImpJ/VasE family protein